MGCIAGQSEIKISRGKGSRKYSIAELYRKFHSKNLQKRERGFNTTIPTFVRGLKDDRIHLLKLKDVLYQGKKETCVLKTCAGKSIRLTYDHEVFTQRGWVSAKDLTNNDFVATDLLKKHQRKTNKKPAKKPRYNLLRVGGFYPFGHFTKGYKGKVIHRAEVHRLVFDAFLNKLSLKDFIQKTYSKNKLKFTDPKKFHIHHIDHNPKNNKVENLERLSAKDHLRKHSIGYANFEHGNITWDRVKKVTKGKFEDVYDLTVEEPFSNFVANDIVVHNSGKTLSAITTLREVYQREGRLLRTLILCPPIVIDNWRKEILSGSKIMDWDIVPLTKSQKERCQTFKALCHEERDDKRLPIPKIVITNFESVLMIELLKLMHHWQPEVLVIDESHRCKDPRAKRTQVICDFADRSKYRYILTGTPILNSPMDIFSQFRILDKGDTFGQNFFAFRAKYFYDKNAGMPKQKHFPDWKPKPGAENAINKLVAMKSMYVKKEDCLDLPPLVTQNVYVELSPEQRRIYNDMRRDFIAYMGEGACIATLAITKALRLMQIASGFVNVEGENNECKSIRLEDNPRAKVLKELLEEITLHSKVLVWAVFKENYATIREVCNALGLSFVEVHGEVGAEEKIKAVEKFNKDPECRVFLGHPGSGGIGINLVSASYSIFYSRNFSLEQDLQAEARNHRGGAEIHDKITRINLIAKDTLDEVIVEALSRKIQISEKVLKKIAREVDEHMEESTWILESLQSGATL